MTKIKIKEIEWDEYNITHIGKHNVTKGEVQEAGKLLVYHRRTYSNRYLAIGRSKSRLLTLILRRISTAKYYVISARDASKKEREDVYEKEKK